jgi:SAM-dependent methyltransferase
VLPGVLRLLAPQAGQRALDVACGQGVLCRILRERGVEVTGVDAAAELIRAARDRGPGRRRLSRRRRARADVPAAGDFDAASCVLAIQNIHPIAPVFAGAARALRDGGRLVIVMMHPAFRGPKETTWGWDERGKVQFRRVDRYLLPRKTPITTHPGKDPGQYTWTFHKPIEAYVKALRQRLLVDAIEEWPSHKPARAAPAPPRRTRPQGDPDVHGDPRAQGRAAPAPDADATPSDQ